MSVYVDDSAYPFRGQRYCHMIADSHDELESMARKLGLNPTWIQHPDSYQEHYDLSPSMRRDAVRFGAIEVSGRRLALRCVERRNGSVN